MAPGDENKACSGVEGEEQEFVAKLEYWLDGNPSKGDGENWNASLYGDKRSFREAS